MAMGQLDIERRIRVAGELARRIPCKYGEQARRLHEYNKEGTPYTALRNCTAISWRPLLRGRERMTSATCRTIPPGAGDFDAAILAHRQRIAQQKGNAAQALVAGDDFMAGAGAGAVENQQRRPGLDAAPIVVAAVAHGGGSSYGQRRPGCSFRPVGKVTHRRPLSAEIIANALPKGVARAIICPVNRASSI